MVSCCRVCNTGEAAVEGCYLGRSVPRKVAAAEVRCTTDGWMHSPPSVDAEAPSSIKRSTTIRWAPCDRHSKHGSCTEPTARPSEVDGLLACFAMSTTHAQMRAATTSITPPPCTPHSARYETNVALHFMALVGCRLSAPTPLVEKELRGIRRTWHDICSGPASDLLVVHTSPKMGSSILNRDPRRAPRWGGEGCGVNPAAKFSRLA